MKLFDQYPWLRRWETLLFIVLIMVVIVNISLSEHYFSIANFANIFNLSIEKSFVVLTMAFVIINGEIDLSVASVMGLSAAVMAYKLEGGASFETSLAYAMAAGLGCGLLNGFFVAYLGIPSLVITLAGLIAYRGAARVLLETRSVGEFPDWFTSFAREEVDVRFGVAALFLLVGARSLLYIGYWYYRATYKNRADSGDIDGQVKPSTKPIILMWIISNVILLFLYIVHLGLFEATTYIFVVLFVICLAILQLTSFGRYVYVIGNNRQGAEYAGLRVKQVKMSIFVASALMSAFAGLMYAARVGNVNASAAQGFELDIITIVLLGGVSIFGGTGTMIGVGLSLLVVLNLRNGMSLRNIDDYVRASVVGALLILSVLIPNWVQTIQRFLTRRTISDNKVSLGLEKKEVHEST